MYRLRDYPDPWTDNHYKSPPSDVKEAPEGVGKGCIETGTPAHL